MAQRPERPRDVADDKAAIRQRMRDVRDGIPAAVMASISGRIRAQVQSLVQAEEAWRTIGLFAAIPGEVDLLPLVDTLTCAGRVVAFPRIDGAASMRFLSVDRVDELRVTPATPGLPDLREPSASARVAMPDVIVVPGLSFDLNGGRLGHGGGFYDAFLSGTTSVVAIGVCPYAQVCQVIPMDSRDVRVDCLVTEDDVYRCSRHADL